MNRSRGEFKEAEMKTNSLATNWKQIGEEIDRKLEELISLASSQKKMDLMEEYHLLLDSHERKKTKIQGAPTDGFTMDAPIEASLGDLKFEDEDEVSFEIEFRSYSGLTQPPPTAVKFDLQTGIVEKFDLQIGSMEELDLDDGNRSGTGTKGEGEFRIDPEVGSIALPALERLGPPPWMRQTGEAGFNFIAAPIFAIVGWETEIAEDGMSLKKTTRVGDEVGPAEQARVGCLGSGLNRIGNAISHNPVSNGFGSLRGLKPTKLGPPPWPNFSLDSERLIWAEVINGPKDKISPVFRICFIRPPLYFLRRSPGSIGRLRIHPPTTSPLRFPPPEPPWFRPTNFFCTITGSLSLSRLSGRKEAASDAPGDFRIRTRHIKPLPEDPEERTSLSEL